MILIIILMKYKTMTKYHVLRESESCQLEI